MTKWLITRHFYDQLRQPFGGIGATGRFNGLRHTDKPRRITRQA
jgi:hypothetical protein